MGYKGDKERVGMNKKEFRKNHNLIDWSKGKQKDKTIIKKHNKTTIIYK